MATAEPLCFDSILKETTHIHLGLSMMLPICFFTDTVYDIKNIPSVMVNIYCEHGSI